MPSVRGKFPEFKGSFLLKYQPTDEDRRVEQKSRSLEAKRSKDPKDFQWICFGDNITLCFMNMKFAFDPIINFMKENGTSINIKDLSLWFGGVRALTDINLEIRRNENLAIIRAKWRGKTCLLIA